MEVTFHEAKRQKTLQERGLDFADAAIAFKGLTLTLRDDRKDYGEDRFQTYGLLHDRIVMVVWTKRNGSRRIISMRHCHDEEANEARRRLGRP